MAKNKLKANVDVEKAVAPVDSKEFIALSDDDLVVLRQVQAELTKLKVFVANHTIRLYEMQEYLKNLTVDAKNKEKEFMDEARKVTKAHGVDVDQPDQGQWNIDLDNNTLNKLV